MLFSRRNRARRFAMMLTASTLISQRAATAGHQPNRKGTTLVIGAGISGIAAARKLQAAGQKVVVLDGRDRIGGRIWTDRTWEDVPVDLGASWIHGVRFNPVARMVKEFKLPTVIYDTGTLSENTKVSRLYTVDGQLVSAAQLLQLSGDQEYVNDHLLKFAEKASSKLAAGTALLEVLSKSSMSETRRENVFELQNRVVEDNFGAGINEIAAWGLDEGANFGGHEVVFPQGYDQLVDRLSLGLDVRFDQTVTQIEYGGNRVRVHTNRGALEADRVIVTLPLGVLKARTVKFTPELPDEKLGAIERLGMGIYDKLYLRFPKVFWDNVPVISQRGNQHGKWANWYALQHVVNAPILCALNGGDAARRIERMKDAEIVRDAMERLASIYGSRILEPTGYRVTRWGADPFSRGSYSFPAIGSRRGDRQLLAAPIADRVFFAGEATHEDYSGTVHGALLSGWRAASRILG
ncbi:flavin monoamine oxidase family protein [Burkholderia ubonensis]|uniref:flavin monoamine oxidase family protein n=2 Tax=Burkholderia ubonensis TaxID=101571 RepID=UPI0009B2FBDC|nr:FAD-dependent oxidoreductase [Burkholderia ubonensis]